MNRLLIIIPTEILTDVKDAAIVAFGEVARAAFVPAGSPTGSVPATHWWLSGTFDSAAQEKLPSLRAAFPSARIDGYNIMQQHGRPWEILKEMGLKPIVEALP